MTDLAWMRTYVGDEAAVTGHLTAEEFGAYERLRRHYWQHGSLPEDQHRLIRISGVDRDRWETVMSGLTPILAEALPRLDRERATASEQRERKVAAGRKGAATRWGDGNANASANSNRNGSATGVNDPTEDGNGRGIGNRNGNGPANAEPIATSTSTRYGAYEEKAPTHTHAHAREPVPRFTSRVAAGQWLTDHADLFPGDPGFDAKIDRLVAGTLTWDDIRRAA